MYTIEHFAVVAIPPSVLYGHHRRRLPRGHALLLVLIATQLPDTIDKPPAWPFGIIPSGRMLAHSLVTAVPVLTLIYVFATRHGFRRPATLLCLAYLSHIAADSYAIL